MTTVGPGGSCSGTVPPAAFRTALKRASRGAPSERAVSGVRCDQTGGWRASRVSSIQFLDCSLPESRFGIAHLPRRSRIDDSTFERCNLEGSVFTKADVLGCTFTDTQLASKWDTVFSDCTFRRCRFERVGLATFQRCTFEDVVLVDSRGTGHFEQCTLRATRVHGSFRGKFVDSEIADSDFSGALIGQASGFIGSRLHGVALPSGSRGYVVRYADLLDGFEAVAPLVRPETAATLLDIGRAFRSSKAIGAVEDDDFHDLAAEEQAAVLEAFLPYRLVRV